MPGQRRLCGERRGVRVANLAEHQHLRVLPKDASQGALIGQLSKRRDFDLRDAGNIALNRIFQ